MTKTELENAMREAVSTILDVRDNKTIRFGWGSSSDAGSAPSFSRNSNVVIIFDTIVDDRINRTNDVMYENDADDTLAQISTSIDVHEFLFVCYGPKSFDWAREIRNNINLPTIAEHLQKNKLFYIPDTPAVQVVPELVNGEWWDRTDVKIRFNEHVAIKKKKAVKAVKSATVKTVSANKTPKKEDE